MSDNYNANNRKDLKIMVALGIIGKIILGILGILWKIIVWIVELVGGIFLGGYLIYVFGIIILGCIYSALNR